MSFEQPHRYRARLDFLYQSIAVYAAAIVAYLVIRSAVVTEAFPSLWQDPLLLLLCAITFVSIVALLYNLLMRRQIEIDQSVFRFRSRVRERVFARDQIQLIQVGPRFRQPKTQIRMVRIKLKDHRRPIRIRLSNFENRKRLLADLREWGGALVREPRTLPTPVGKEPAR
jgi:hypothetical protein